MNNEWLLLQLIDSASPTGAFSHSFGLETAVKEKKLQSKEDLFEWMKVFEEGSLAPTEGKAVFIAHEAVTSLLSNDMEKEAFDPLIQELDHRLFFSKIPFEGREASRKIGKRFLRNVITLYPEAELQGYDQWVRDEICFGNSAIVHGWISAYLNLDPHISVFTYLYTSVNNLLQSAIRLNIVGQTDVQLILRDLYPSLKQTAQEIVEARPALKDFYTFSLIQEIESMRHETLYSRLFMS